MKNIIKQTLKKLLSRKFLTALAGIFMGVSITGGGDADTVTAVAGAVVSLVSAVSYIVTEGRVDAMSVSRALQGLEQAQRALGETESGKDMH